MIAQPEEEYSFPDIGRDEKGRFTRDDRIVRQALVDINDILTILVRSADLSSRGRVDTGRSLKRLRYIIDVLDSGTRPGKEDSNALQEQEASGVDVRE